MYQSVLFFLLAFLPGTFKTSAQQVAADPAVGVARFTQNSVVSTGPFTRNTVYTVVVNVKNSSGSSAIPPSGFTVVIQLGRGLKFEGPFALLSANYTWTVDSLFDPSQTIVRGVLRNSVPSNYNEDISIPVRTVNGCISNNQLLTGININSSIIVNGNDFLNDDAFYQYAVFTPPNAGRIGGNLRFGVGTVGSSYQWQVNTGTGFSNLADNTIYAGVTTDTLTIKNIQGTFSGTIYRAVIQTTNGIIYSPEQVVRFDNYWNGLQNSDWHSSANWSCCQVPDEYTDVIIPPSATNQPQVNSNASAKSLTALNGSRLTIKSTAVLEVKGRN